MPSLRRTAASPCIGSNNDKEEWDRRQVRTNVLLICVQATGHCGCLWLDGGRASSDATSELHLHLWGRKKKILQGPLAEPPSTPIPAATPTTRATPSTKTLLRSTSLWRFQESGEERAGVGRTQRLDRLWH
ncbi:hypothetical protein L1887_54039 [Cichorium endivia]|nr:hypothetical protein L1887_54039 [Cichorium endivia]